MKISEKVYETLTPTERIALSIEAMSRKDYVEAERITDTCEVKQYAMPDARYTGGMQCVQTCCLYAILFIQEAESREFAARVAVLANPKKDQRACRNYAAEAHLLAVNEILGVWEAWCHFCKKVGVDPKSTMVAYWGSPPNFVIEHLKSEIPESVKNPNYYSGFLPSGRNYPSSNLPKSYRGDDEIKTTVARIFNDQWRSIQRLAA